MKKLKSTGREKKMALSKKGLYRVRIKTNTDWDLWENDFRVVVLIREDDARVKFTRNDRFLMSITI